MAQVTDTWPGIKQVTVTVQCTATCPSPNYANMTFNNTSGYYESVFDFIMGQSITFNITAYDLVGNKITSQLFSGVVNNRPPKITSYYLYSSYTNTTIYSNESLLLHYSYSDPENEPDNSLIYWYKNNTLQSAYNNLKSIPTTAFKKGDTWYASIIPYDGYVYGNTVNTTTITIQNTPPTVSTSLMSVMSSQNLTASFSFSDYDNDRTNYTIWWYKNGSLVSSLNNKSYVSPSFIKRGEYWYFRIGVSDGTNTTYKNSNGVYIKDTPPVLTGSPGFTINNVTNIQDLIVNYTGLYYDYDGDPENNSSISPLIRWYINGTYNSSFDNQLIIYGNSSHPINSLYYYIIYVYDGYNYSLGYKSIPNYEGGYTDKYAPQISNLYFANSFNQTCDNNCTSHDSIGIYYHYQDNDTPSNPEFGSTYLWYLYVNGIPVLQSQYTNMKILPNGTFIHGEIWYVIVTPCDGSLNGTSVQSGNLTIIDIIPYISTGSIQILASNGTFINEQNTTTDENLYANWIAVDGDNDSLQFEIKWYENNSLISNYQNATLIPSNMTRKGETWIFSIRAWDGFYWSNWKNFSISIIDSPPTISHFVLVGGENKTIPISISFLFSDPDNDTNNSIIIWYVNGQPVSGPTNITMFSAFNAGDQVYVVVKSYDGQLFGNIITSLKITIGDAIPISSKPYIYYGNNITSTFFANDTLYVNFTASDADGNYCSGSTCYGLLPFPYSANYRWYLNNTLQPSLNSYFVPSQYLKKGDIWTVSIQPIDRALGAGLWYNCTITIIDAPPTISAFSWSDNYPTTQTDLQISFSTSDIDGDSVQTIITWYVDDTMVLNGSSYILNTNYFIKNKIVKVQINVTDGQNSSIYLKSIKILNTPPTINSISIDKGQNIYANDSLSLSFNYYDADMDPNASTIIRWFMIYRGITYSEIALNNQFSINSSYTVKDEVWYASIQVYDGQNYSIIYYTANYLILDSAPYISSLSINNNLNINKTTFTNTTLYATYLPKDNDVGDTVIAVNIIWYLNGVYNSTFNNMTSINPIYTKKGETWY